MNTPNPTRPAHPKGLYLLFLTEMWERFGYYLMIGILFLYMTKADGLGLEKGNANDIYGTYLALVYLTPFLGGLLADRAFGYRKTIILGGTLMAAGYLTLVIPGENAFFTALFLIIIGNGFFKPNISTLLGNLYNDPAYVALKDRGYNIFYMGINVGAFVCNFVAAYLRQNYGWGWAFGAAGVGMLIGLVIFIVGQKQVKEADVLKPTQPEDMPLARIFSTIILPALAAALLGYFASGLLGMKYLVGSKTNDAFLFACVPIIYFFARIYYKAPVKDKRPLGVLFYVFGVVVIFWMIFHQNGNVLTTWAEEYTHREVPTAIEATATQLKLVEEVEAQIQLVPKKDEEGRVVMYKWDTVKVGRYPVYLKNLSREEWPAQGESLKLVSTEIFQSINPGFVILLTPLVIAFFNFLAMRGMEPSTPAKIAWGLLITGLSTLVMILAVAASDNGVEKASAWWLITSYGVVTIGELFLSPMGLSLVSKLSHRRLTSLMMGGWFLAVAIGNKLSGVVGHIGANSDDKSVVFWINFSGAMFSALLLFIMLKHFTRITKETTGRL
ncbi:MAG: peptide MFS transporter [Thermonemataceae bacterium]